MVAEANFDTTFPLETSFPISFGFRPAAELLQGRRFVGMMDEVAIFDRALSPDEIRTIFDAGSAGMIKP